MTHEQINAYEKAMKRNQMIHLQHMPYLQNIAYEKAKQRNHTPLRHNWLDENTIEILCVDELTDYETYVTVDFENGVVTNVEIREID